MSIESEVAILVAQLGVGAGLGAAARALRTQVSTRRPASRIWGLPRNSVVNIVTAQDDDDFASEYTVKVYPAEYLAAVSVREMLLAVDSRISVSLSTASEFSMKHAASDSIVSIGGPVHNRVTKLLLDRLDTPISFVGFAIRSRPSGQSYEAIVDLSSHRVTKDYGLLIVDRSPLTESAKVVVIAGSRTFGCAAAAKFLTSGSLREVDRLLGASYPKWAIIEADVVDDFVVTAEVMESSGLAGPRR